MNKIDYLGLGKVALLDVVVAILTFANIEAGLKVLLIIVTIGYTILKGLNELKKFLNKDEKDIADN